MNHAPLTSNAGVGAQRPENRSRTITDTALIAMWVAGYALILMIFRVVEVMESLVGNRRGDKAEDHS